MSSVYLRSAGVACAVLILAGCAARKPASITEAQPEAAQAGRVRTGEKRRSHDRHLVFELQAEGRQR